MKERLTKFLAAALILFFAAPPVEALYRFDDVFGPSGVGGQWMVVTTDMDTGGDATLKNPLDTQGNLVLNRDSVFITNGEGLDPFPADGWAIHTMFLVISGDKGNMRVSFDWVPPPPTPTQDVLVDNTEYQVVKTPLSTSSAPDKLFDLLFTKTTGASLYSSVRGNFIFHQNPVGLPSQTLQVPFIVANVYDGTAAGNPLLFRATTRETATGSSTGDIVAFDRFFWDVTADATFGTPGDWVFVPISKLPIDSNTVNYRLSTEIVNYTGIRYAMQRYDGYIWHHMYPSRWAFDIPAVADVPANLYLDELSHIPPGLTTTYNQTFNAVSGFKEVMHVYPVDPASGFRNLTISHRPILGLILGTVKDSASPPVWSVTGFQLLSAATNFLESVGATMNVSNLQMPEPSHGVMSGSVAYTYVTGETIASFAVNAPVPAIMTGKNGSGLLPLHITFNLPRANSLLAPEWSALLKEWRDTGTIRSTFATKFSIYLRDAFGHDLDLIQWLKAQGAYDKTVKVFLDEQRGVVTVSVVVLLTDGPSSMVRLVKDDTATTSNTYVAVMDGNSNSRWDMTFFVAPANLVPPSTTTKGSGGGGGCDALAAGALLLPFCGVAFLKRRLGR